jgi:hypothetical protein
MKEHGHVHLISPLSSTHFPPTPRRWRRRRLRPSLPRPCSIFLAPAGGRRRRTAPVAGSQQTSSRCHYCTSPAGQIFDEPYPLRRRTGGQASPPDRRPGFAASGRDISASMEDRDELASRLVRAELYKAATRSSFF